MQQDLSQLETLVRTIPNFPKEGILFRDITTLILDPWGLKRSTEFLSETVRAMSPHKLIGIESRGFIFGASVASALGCGLVLARKKGKLPGDTVEIVYDLEYGKDCLQIHRDAIQPGERCVIIDDLLATGGTALAAAQLIERMGGIVAGCQFVINLPDLGGSAKLAKYKTNWLLEFPGH